jgi:hypothetical protein
MGSREDLDRLLALGHDLSRQRLELARTREDAFPVSTLRLMRTSGNPLDRAAAWLVSAQRRPVTFLRLVGRAMDDAEAVVRSAAMEGVGLAALVLERTPRDPVVSMLLARGASDPSAVVRRTAGESLALLERFAEAEERASLPPEEALRLAFIERLLPESRAPRRERPKPQRKAKRIASTERPGPGAEAARPDPALSALLEELVPLASSVAECAVSRELSGRDVEEIVRAAREDASIDSAVREVEALLLRRGRSRPSAWEALARAIRDTVPGRRAPTR